MKKIDRNRPQGNWWLVLSVVALTILPLVLVKGEYGGADGQAKEAIGEIQPGYEPWFDGVFTPPSGEIESLLFVSQGAIGAGIVGYVIGRYKGRREGAASRSEQDDQRQ